MSQDKASSAPERPLGLAVRRGLAGRCPHCGEGRLFRAYLKVNNACPVCGEDFTPQRADDAPAYVTILIVCHFVVAGVVAAEDLWPNSPVLVAALVWAALAAALSLAMLPRVKGALIGYQWAARMHGFGDPARERRERAGRAANRPRDAATLILVDRSQGAARALLGRRHPGHAFMPNKFVFPGGALEPADRRMSVATPLDPLVEAKLMAETRRPSPDFARALALAAIRETFEETGLALGVADRGVRMRPPAAPGRASPPQASRRLSINSISSRAPSRRPAARAATMRASSSPTRRRSLFALQGWSMTRPS